MCLAVPGQIVSVTEGEPMSRMGRVSFGGVIKEICLAYVPEAREGDWVVVHAGFALDKLDEAEALQVFEYLKQVDALNELDATAEDGAAKTPVEGDAR
jgi:hydrogenase expression/formation protein HypC